MPRPVEAVACDLDRTLIGEDALLSQRTIEAIQGIRRADIPFVVVTGRMFRSVRPYLEQAGLDEPVVCYQGAVVADPASGEFLLHVPIPLELAREALAAFEAEGVHVNCYVGDELFVAEVNEYARRYADFQHIPVTPVGRLSDWLDAPPTKLVAVDDDRRITELAERFRGLFKERLFVSTSLPIFLELASPNVSKGSGLQFVAERLGFERGRTIAFGDGENDVELLEWAGYGIAVADAHPRLRAVADWTCPGPNEAGVASVLEALLDSKSL
ncbi:MAG: HAD family hydrolase [Actinobacteria bacterium]|nr:HAD family hydrolase [Actinomycetota bacterium]